MPSKTWHTKADWDGAYGTRLERYNPNGAVGPVELRGNYERRARFNPLVPQLDKVTPEWSRIVAHFGWPPTTSILVVGCGFGWSVEYLQSVGYASSWGLEPSLYIQSDKDKIDSADGLLRSKDPGRVRDEDVSRPANRGQLLRNTVGPGNRFDVIVSERVLTSLTDAEAVSFRNDLDEMRADPSGVIVHIEASGVPGPGRDPAMNWKTLADWKTLLPLDTMVRSGGRDFL